MEKFNGFISHFNADSLYQNLMVNYDSYFIKRKKENVVPEFDRVVYNVPATIVFWKDGTKTVVKAMDGDAFDPERGYLQAFYEKTLEDNSSRAQCNKFLVSLRKQYKAQLDWKYFINGSLF